MNMRRSRSLLVGMAGAALVVGCSSSGLTSDATVFGCIPGTDDAKPRATGEIANNSSKKSDFFIRIVFSDSSDNRVAEGVTTVTNVEPGTTSPWNIGALADANGPVTCEVETVRRTVTAGS